MKSQIKAIGWLLLSLTSLPAWAGPILSTNCEVARRIRVPIDANGYYMSSDCKSAFVLPPQVGKAVINGRTIGDVNQCQMASNARRDLLRINKEIAKAISQKANTDTLKVLHDEETLLEKKYKSIMNGRGAAVEMNYRMNIGEHLVRYQKLNPNLGISFVPVTLSNATVFWNNNESDGDTAGINLALNRSVPLAANGNIGAGSFSGRVDLTYFGLCSIYDNNYGDIPTELRYSELAGLITPNVQYEYVLGGTCKYRARYNLGALAKTIKETSSSGGFFETSTASSMTDTASSNSWFSLIMSCDDKRVEEKVAFAKAVEIKRALMQQVLDQISIAKLGYKVDTEEAGEPGENGASKASAALKKCAHPYCQAGAIVLDIADAIWGGSNKTDTFIKANDHESGDSVEQTFPVTFIGSMGFGG